MRISDWSSDVCSSDLQRDYPEGAWHHPRRCDAALPPAAPVRWLAELRARTVGEGGRLGDHGQASSQRGRRLLADAGLRDRNGLVSDLSKSEEHTSELQSLMRISYAVFCLKKHKTKNNPIYTIR